MTRASGAPHAAHTTRHAGALRLAAGVAVGTVAMLVVPDAWRLPTRMMIAWNLGVAAWLAVAWHTIVRSDVRSTRRHAEALDPSGGLVFFAVLLAALASTVAIGVLLGNRTQGAQPERVAHLVLAVLALIAAWALIHSLFTFHYARQYYGAPIGRDPRGMAFPGDQDPDYLDFAYFAFVIGMTSQVSDVDVTSRPMRHLVLAHAVVSFLFNVTVIALGVNIAGGG